VGPVSGPPKDAKKMHRGRPGQLLFVGFFVFFFFNREWRYREGQGGRKDQLNPREGREEEGLLHSRCK